MAHRLMVLSLPLLLAGCVIYDDREERVIPGRDPLSVSEIIALSRGGVTDDTILRELAANGVVRKVSVDDILEMKSGGVSETVIAAAVGTEVTTPRAAEVVYEGRVYREYYYSDPGVWFGLGWLLGWNRHGHHHAAPVRRHSRW